QNGEETVLARLREAEALGLLSGRCGHRGDLLKFPQAPRRGFVPGVLAVLDPLQALAELPVQEARVVLGQLDGEHRLERGGLVGGRRQLIQLAGVVLTNSKNRRSGCGRRSPPTRASTRTGASTTGSAVSTSPIAVGSGGSQDTYGACS